MSAAGAGARRAAAVAGADRAPDPAPAATGVERIAAAFASHGKRAALMPYLMGGFPDIETSRAIGEACAAAGADLLELGVPYSDPLADGPVIHAAAGAALRAGASTGAVLDVAAKLARRLPVAVMCYANIVLAQGVEEFASRLAGAGVSALIVPDLPLEESSAALAACDERGIGLVPLVAPTTSEERMARIGAQARGFLYAVSVRGTTGEREALAPDLESVVRRAAERTEVPVAVGFGIATPAHAAAAAAAGADGVIVGTRLVRAAGEAADPAAAVGELVAEMAAALHR